MSDNKKITGIVKFAGKSNDEKNIVSLLLTDERAKELTTKLSFDPEKYEGIPIKENTDGELLFKASSKYPVKIYDNGTEITQETSISEIGEESHVELFIGLSESTYKRKKYQVAYLKAINILELVPAETFNPFAKDSDLEEV